MPVFCKGDRRVVPDFEIIISFNHKNAPMKFPFQKSILLLILIVATNFLYAQSPGAVSDFSIWLQGDFNQNHAAQEYLNNNKSPGFEGEEKIEIPHLLKKLQRATILTVYKEQSSYFEMPVWEITGPFPGLSLSTQNISKEKGKDKLPYVIKSESQIESKPSVKINRYTRSMLKKSTGSSHDEPAILTFGQSTFTGLTNGFTGVIAEFVLYERILKPNEVDRLESYLAIKYGVSLQKDYLNSADQKVWNYDKYKEYSNHIAGISRDDRAGLYQIKSSADNNLEKLTIAVNHSVNAEIDDEKLMDDMCYLLWGDNGKPLAFEERPPVDQNEFMIIDKKWLVNAELINSSALSTSMKIDLKELVTENILPEDIYLLIDRSGKGEFSNGAMDIIHQSNFPIDGLLSFNNIKWDTDGSGKDVFTFAHRNIAGADESTFGLQGISVNAFPNPSLDGNYKLSISLATPTDIEVQIFDAQQRLVEVKVGNGKTEYHFPGFIERGPGVYTFFIKTPEENITHKFIIE